MYDMKLITIVTINMLTKDEVSRVHLKLKNL